MSGRVPVVVALLLSCLPRCAAAQNPTFSSKIEAVRVDTSR